MLVGDWYEYLREEVACFRLVARKSSLSHLDMLFQTLAKIWFSRNSSR